ncbi:VOC family protein [Frondihabitans sp. PAMC 28766]|uniref:VOC family protein n=1 Tax=Frondihabitans sp. PAMC 28766 TaxID=1795630 RepID=UPI0019525D3E|nr:VOC family protein [Frondihabitans sp. PAMC 28766]
MTVTRVIPNLRVDDLDAARRFYVDSLGMVEEPLGLEWITRFLDDSTGTALQVFTHDATAHENPAATVKVTDVDATYATMQAAGYEIVHPLVTEEWGVRRFFVRPPGGAVLNIAQDHD